ncbi:MAG: hypothetical protein WEA36_09150 [Balneolaceae bacterium]
MKSSTTLHVLLSLLLIVVLWSGCDTAIDPIRNSDDRYIYSIHGLLDASADTQWVRIMPFRESFRPDGTPIDATVTLEHLDSGDQFVWSDSLFQFGTLQAWNFWTDEPLIPGDSYRLTAQRSDGKSSSATLSIPETVPRPLVELGEVIEEDQEILFDQITIYGVERIAYVFLYFELDIDQEKIQTTFDTPVLDKRHFRIAVSHLAEPGGTPGEWRLTIDRRALDLDFVYYLEPMMPFPLSPSNLWDYVEMGRSQVSVIAAEPSWPEFTTLSNEEIELPDGISNVENGLGFVAGVTGVTVPYESCTEPGSGVATPCPAEPTMNPSGLVKVVYDHD